MQTYLISNSDVKRYAQDFLERIVLMGEHSPCAWVSLGLSGDKMLEVLDLLMEERGLETPPIITLSFDRVSDSVTYRSVDAGEVLEAVEKQDRPLLLVDSAIHSGKSMRRIVDHLYALGIKEIMSYSLVMKQTSEFVPTFFGLTIGAHDRAFFQLPRIPNHRLSVRRPIGSMRMLRGDDVKRDFLNTETASINKMSYGDLLYLGATQHFLTYAYEMAGSIAGIITFKVQANGFLFIELIARDVKWEAAKLGGLLLRWAETYARHSNCIGIELMAIEQEVGFYGRYYFEKSTEPPLDLGDEKYFRMTRRLLYNIRPMEQVTLDYLDQKSIVAHS
jgi:hypothetical protein